MRDMKTRNAKLARDIAELAKHESLSLQTLELDVTSDASLERAVSKVVLECGRLDVLVNNAGYGAMDLAETVKRRRRSGSLTRIFSASYG